MKLRILGNSIRLRVSKSELDELAASGSVGDAIEFAANVRLVYRIASAGEGAASARFGADEIVVSLPAEAVRQLAETDQVSIRGEQALAGGETLKILVEKDFECLVPRPGEESEGLFENPAKS